MRRRWVLALAVALLAGVALLVLVRGDDGDVDPLAFQEGEREAFERNAAAGLSHVLYAKSPGGATATARRTARWRQQVNSAAAESGSDPDLVEALVFVESAGRPDVIAGDDPEAASGLTQILAETATGLLGMRVDLARSRRLTRRIARAETGSEARRLRAARRRIDQRFDPERALAATGRYLSIARERFGREDLAIASYHMGIGNLERVLRAHGGDDLSYARLFFESTPVSHTEAHELLAGFGDDSSTYLWRVLAAREIMRLHRERPAELERLEDLHSRKASAEEVLHPRDRTMVFGSARELRDARTAGALVELPDDPERFHFEIDPQMGELAPRLGEQRELYRALRPQALALLVYLAAGVEAVSDGSTLTVSSTVRDSSYQRALGRRNREATREYSLHTTGYSFDVLREYESREQALAFEFWLNRLQAMNLIAWVREPAAIHVTVSSQAGERLPDPDR